MTAPSEPSARRRTALESAPRLDPADRPPAARVRALAGEVAELCELLEELSPDDAVRAHRTVKGLRAAAAMLDDLPATPTARRRGGR